MEIELKNFRAFDDSEPARWKLRDGFVAFVGLNNSGKSSLLRFFHEARPAFKLFERPAEREGIFRGSPGSVGFQSVADVEEVFCNRNSRDMTATFSLQPDEELRAIQPSAVRFHWRRQDASMSLQFEVDGAPVSVASLKNKDEFVASHRGARVAVNFSRFRAEFADLSRAIYLGPFRNAVNVGGSNEYYDLQIGEQFIAAWDSFKTGNNRAWNRAAIAVERELEGIFGLSKLEINAAPGNATLQLIVDDEPFQLQEQGAGLAQFIHILAFVATRKSSYILIDEPELNLHPALQLDFLTTLARYCERGVAFATHNIGLARSIGEEVYSVRVVAGKRREIRSLEATKDYAQLLGELSYSGYTDLGFSRVLLVEGPTEVPVVQRWLRFYGIEHEVLLLPLGGSSLINASSAPALAEICRIASDVFVLIDSERTSAGVELDGARAGFLDVCGELGFRTHVLERRALENYFTDSAVKAVKGDRYRALGEFESLGAATPGWGKSENWRIAAEMTRDDLEVTDLGRFLASLGDDPRQEH